MVLFFVSLKEQLSEVERLEPGAFIHLNEFGTDKIRNVVEEKLGEHLDESGVVANDAVNDGRAAKFFDDGFKLKDTAVIFVENFP